jgi:hypothetical protein
MALLMAMGWPAWVPITTKQLLHEGASVIVTAVLAAMNFLFQQWPGKPRHLVRKGMKGSSIYRYCSLRYCRRVQARERIRCFSLVAGLNARRP